jgi:DNA-binding PadR family transcriptional regulator
MSKQRKDWDFDFRGLDPANWGGWWRGGWHHARRRGRQQMFESGEMKFVILRLIREKPRHGYEIIKALEEKFAGCYTPSAGTVYPTLQLLEDQGYIRGIEEDGRKVYRSTPEGEALLDSRRDEVDEIFERVRDTIRDVAGGGLGEVGAAFGRLASVTFSRAWRRSAEDPAVARVVEVLGQATADIERAWSAGNDKPEPESEDKSDG